MARNWTSRSARSLRASPCARCRVRRTNRSAATLRFADAVHLDDRSQRLQPVRGVPDVAGSSGRLQNDATTSAREASTMRWRATSAFRLSRCRSAGDNVALEGNDASRSSSLSTIGTPRSGSTCRATVDVPLAGSRTRPRRVCERPHAPAYAGNLRWNPTPGGNRLGRAVARLRSLDVEGSHDRISEGRLLAREQVPNDAKPGGARLLDSEATEFIGEHPGNDDADFDAGKRVRVETHRVGPCFRVVRSCSVHRLETPLPSLDIGRP